MADIEVSCVQCNDTKKSNKKNKVWDSGQVGLGFCLLVGIRVCV